MSQKIKYPVGTILRNKGLLPCLDNCEKAIVSKVSTGGGVFALDYLPSNATNSVFGWLVGY